MSNTNWPSIFLTWLFFGSFTLAVIAWAVWQLASDQTELRQMGNQSAQRHIEYAEDRIEMLCLHFEGKPLRDCIHEEIEAALDHSRSEQNLYAQQEVALFTKIMGFTAIAGLFFGAASVVLIYFTLRETQRMANETREVGEAQVKGYLSFDRIQPIYLGDDSQPPWTDVGFRPWVRNTGNSPAVIRLIKLSARIFKTDPNEVVDIEAIQRSNLSVGAGREVHLGRSVFSWEQLTKMQTPQEYITVTILVDYEDVFGRISVLSTEVKIVPKGKFEDNNLPFDKQPSCEWIAIQPPAAESP